VSDDRDDEPRRLPSDATPYGRIIGRDRWRYAQAWDCDLTTAEGREEFSICCKMMSCARAELEGIGKGPPPWRKIDLEQFAANWRPPTLSETLEWLYEDEKQRRAEPEGPSPLN
jgi:hypothetical protein